MIVIMRNFCATLMLGMMLMPALAQAQDCAGPARVEGDIIYNQGSNVPQVCAGGEWVALGVINPAAGGGSCANPARTEGAIVYNIDHKVLQYCDGTDWVAMHASGGGGGGGCGAACDNIADLFTFTDLPNQVASTLLTSEIVEIKGLVGTSVDISISGDGSPQFRVCSTATCSAVTYDWGNAAQSIGNSYIQVRLTSSATPGAVNSAVINVGSISDQWNVSTQTPGDPCAGSPSPGSICADGTVYAGLTPDGNVPMYTTSSDLGQHPWNNGVFANYTTTGITNANTGEANTNALIGLDSDSATAGVQPHQAAQACYDLIVHGHDDWYLPSTGEYSVLHTNRVAIGNFNATSGVYYNTSRETSNNQISAWSFNLGSIVGVGKANNKQTRCVRK